MGDNEYEENNENEELDLNEEFNEEENEGTQSSGGGARGNNIFSKFTNSKNKAKNGAKAAKTAAKSIAAVFKGLVQIIAALPPPVLIALAIILVGIFIFICIKGTNKESGEQINVSIKTVTQAKLEETKNGTITSGEEIERIKKANDYYEKENSFIYFTIEELNEAYDVYEEEYKYSTNDVGQPTYASMSTIYGTKNLSDAQKKSRIVDVNDKIPLYKHMLMTEKYNFNKVEWKWFAHDKDEYGNFIHNGDTITDANKVLDKELGLKYPNDGSTKLETFISLLSPYLETWHIPLAVNSGSINNGTDGKAASAFTYSAIKDAYSDIVAHRYDVQKYILNTTFRDYIQTELKSKIKMYINITETYKAQVDGSTQVSSGMRGTQHDYGTFNIDTTRISDEVKENAKNTKLINYVELNNRILDTKEYVIAKFILNAPLANPAEVGEIDYNSSCVGLTKTSTPSRVVFCRIVRINDQYIIYKQEKNMAYYAGEWHSVSMGTPNDTEWGRVENGTLYYSDYAQMMSKVTQKVNEKNITEPNKYYKAIYRSGIEDFSGTHEEIDLQETFKDVPCSGDYTLVTYDNVTANTYKVVGRTYTVTKNEYKRDGHNYIYDLYYKYEYTRDSVLSQEPVYDYGELGGDYDNTRVPGQIRSTKLLAPVVPVVKDPVASSAPVSTNTVIDPMLEDKKDDKIDITNRYTLQSAKTLDVRVDVALSYTRYRDDYVAARINPKTYKETVEDYNNVVDEENKLEESDLNSYKQKTLAYLENSAGLELLYDESNFHGNTEQSVKEIYNLLKNESPGTEVKKQEGISLADEPGANGIIQSNQLRSNEYLKRDSYIIQVGKKENNQGTHYVERMWEDEFRVLSYKNDTYDVDDLVNFNTQYNSKLNGTTIETEKDKFNKLAKSSFENIDSYAEYEYLEKETKINNIRFINSNKNIFNEYLTDTNRKAKSDIEGYSVGWMELVFDEMKTLFEEKSKKAGTSPYIYGISLGLSGKASAGAPLDASRNYTTYVWPVPDKMEVSYLYGYSIAYDYKNSFHEGIDISKKGVSVVAAASGTITHIVNTYGTEEKIANSYGNCIKIEHADGSTTLYAHLAQGSGSGLNVGDKVKKGDEIGITGNSGNSNGYHLHFEVIDKNGQAIDPMQFFKCEPNVERYPPESGYIIPPQDKLDEIGPDGETYRYSISKQDSYKVVGGAGPAQELVEVVHSWEYGGDPIEKDGVLYYIVHNDGYGHPTVGWGVDLKNSGLAQFFLDAGYDVNTITYGDLMPVELVDAAEAIEFQEKTNGVLRNVGGLNLEEHQINALVSRAYNCGVAGAVEYTRNGDTFIEAYNKYWVGHETTEIDYNHPFYVNYMSKPNTSEGKYSLGLERRRRAEWIYFVTGDPAGNGDSRIGI